jgi:hypothetical protein
VVVPPDASLRLRHQRLFERIAMEAVEKRRHVFDALSEHERRIVVEWLMDAIAGDGEAIHEVLWELDYDERPVGIDEFLESDAYLGRVCGDLHPRLREDLHQIFAPGSQIFELILSGSIGWGKCVSSETLIPTNTGFDRIEDIVQLKPDSIVQTETGLRKVSDVHFEGMTETVKLRTRHGHVFEGRPNHRVRVLAGLDVEWRRLDELQEGDCLLQVPATVFGHDRLPDSVAEFCGWYVAEGHRSSRNVATLDLHPDEVSYVRELAARAVKEGGWRADVIESAGRSRVRVKFAPAIPEDFFQNRKSYDHSVPPAILASDRRSILRFLRGYFSGDGDVSPQLEACTISARLARELRVLLTSLGYYVSVLEGRAMLSGEDKGPKYTVRIIGRASKEKFASEIGFVQAYKQEALEQQFVAARRERDHFWSFYIDKESVVRLRAMQPSFANAAPSGMTKTTTPRGLLAPIAAGQGCTVDRLRRIRGAGGVLPSVFDDLVDGRLLYDTVATIEPSSAWCYDLSVGEDDPSYISDTFISHNTTLACCALAYKLHQLLCLRNPQAYYGLLPDSLMILGVYSITKRQVHDTGYFKLRGFIDASPWFRERYPRNPRLETRMDFTTTGKNIAVLPGSREMHAVGLDLFSFVMDEVNFMRSRTVKETGEMTGQAYDLYSATYTRLLSRYVRPGGSLPGLMILLSSKKAETSFLERHLAEARGRASTYVAEYALWECKPAHRFKLPRFRVEVGDQYAASHILEADDVPRQGARVVEGIPGEFRQPFEEAIEKALCEIAGVAARNDVPLIRRREDIYDAISPNMRHPFRVLIPTVSTHDDTMLDEVLDVSVICRIEDSTWVARLSPGAPRFCHVDIGISGDRLGLAVGHVPGMIKVDRVSPDGVLVRIREPVVVIDLMVGIVAVPGAQVELSKIRAFIRYLTRLYQIARVTFDGYQSTDCMQILTRAGIEAGYLSVDRNDDAYSSLRGALYEHRLMYYEYQPLISELVDLQHWVSKRKVDHQPGGSKDIADAVAGVVWHCMSDKRARGYRGIVDFDAESSVGSEPVEASVRATDLVSQNGSQTVGSTGILWDDLRKNL